MPHAQLNDRRLFYEERGQGPALLFLNGLSGDHLYWKTHFRWFTQRYRCVAIDNRDVGQSDDAREAYGIADLAGDAAALADDLGLGAAHVVGLSMGGMIAQELALARPDLVKSLVLIDTLAGVDGWFSSLVDTFNTIRRQSADSPRFFDAILSWWVGSRYCADPDRVAWLRWMLGQVPQPQKLEGFLRQTEAMRRHGTLDRLHQIRCPVLLLVGEEDAIMPPRYSRTMREALPHAELIVAAGVGHALPLEMGREFDDILKRFVDRVENNDPTSR